MLTANRKSNLPKDAVVLFKDGSDLCAVMGDFDNPVESPQGYGADTIKAMESLRADLDAEQKEIDRRIRVVDDLIDSVYKSNGESEMAIHCKRATRIVNSWPEWKRNAGESALSGKAMSDTPRPHVDNTGDDGGY